LITAVDKILYLAGAALTREPAAANMAVNEGSERMPEMSLFDLRRVN
jgi:hypothetical protein